MIDQYQDIYERRNEHPNYWFNKSSDLRASAGALWYSMEKGNDHSIAEALSFGRGFSMEIACWPVYQMLFGMSFELMLKAIILASCSKPPTTHNLITLAGQDHANVNLDENEQNVFRLLTEAIIWDGRYPTPKKKEILEAHYKNSSATMFDEVPIGELNFKVSNGMLYWPNLDHVWRKLSLIFSEQCDKKST